MGAPIQELKLPELGEDITAVEVSGVLVAVGDTVKQDQPVIEVETEKASLEVPAPAAGTITELLVTKGDEVKVGQVVLRLETIAAGVESASGEEQTPKSEASAEHAAPAGPEPSTPTAGEAGAPVQELKLPELGEDIDAVEVSNVLVSVGDVVKRDQPVIEVETEKASLEVPAPAAGTIMELLVSKGDSIKVGQVVLRIETGGTGAAAGTPPTEPAPAPEVEATPAPAAPLPEQDDEPVVSFPAKHKPTLAPAVPAAPSARALARELGVAIREVPGSGPGGRIHRDDVKAYVKSLVQGRGSAPLPAGQARELPDFTQWGEVERESLTNIRRATAANMANAWTSVPHVTQFDRADITQLESMRKRFNLRPEAEGRKMTVTAILIKLVAAALKQFPKFNASLDLAGDAVVVKKYVHIGVAVDTPRGLLVPVVRDADVKNVVQIAAELNDMAARARDRKLTPDEMRGATFTITNLGGLGTTYFSPIVNWPEVAILGVGRAEQTAIWGDGRFEPRLILPLSLSYDHRLIDGADAARFLRWTAEALEQPLLLLLED